MRRVIRNYLISFLIIALFGVAILLIDRWADEREARLRAASAPAASASAPAAGTPSAPAAAPVAR